MGFFSWHTQDTGRSISNSYSKVRTFKVHMMDNKGNIWTEYNYEGYGEFGGKDYYELLAEMNGLESDRSAGISLAFKDSPSGTNPNAIFPNLIEDPYNWIYTSESPDNCPDQGYFYPNEDEEYEYEDDDWNDDEGDSTQYDD